MDTQRTLMAAGRIDRVSKAAHLIKWINQHRRRVIQTMRVHAAQLKNAIRKWRREFWGSDTAILIKVQHFWWIRKMKCFVQMRNRSRAQRAFRQAAVAINNTETHIYECTVGDCFETGLIAGGGCATGAHLAHTNAIA